MKNKKYFRKLFLAYALIVFVYTFAIVAVFSYENRLIYGNEIENTNKAYLEQAKKHIDMSFMIILKHIEEQKMINELRKFVKNKDHDYYNVFQIFKGLSEYQAAFNQLGYKVGVLRADDDLVICSDNTRTLEEYFNTYMFSNADRSAVKAFISENTPNSSYLIVGGNKSVYESGSYGSGYTTYLNKRKIGINQYIYLIATFYDNILLPNLMQEDTAFVISKDSDIVKAHVMSDESGAEKLMKEAGLYARDSKGYNSRRFSAYSLESDVLRGLEFTYIADNHSTFRINSKFITESIVVYFVLIVIGIFLSFASARKSYTPIKNIMKVFRNLEGSGNDDDEMVFIEKTVLNMEKTNESLKEIINKNRLPLKTKFLRDLIYGLVPDSEIDENVRKYKLDYIIGELNIIVVEFNYEDLHKDYSNESVISIKSHVINAINQSITDNVQCEMFELDYKYQVIISNNSDMELLKKILGKVLSELTGNFDLSVVAAVGEPSDCLYHIRHSFDSCLRLLEYRIITNRNLVITPEDLNNLSQEKYYYPLDIERDLINFTVRGRKEEALNTLYDILDKNLNERKFNRDTINKFIFALAGTINRILHKLNISENEILPEGKGMYAELIMCKNTYKLSDSIVKMFEAIMDKLGDEYEQTDKVYAEKVINFIHERYSDSYLSLTDIEEYMGLSAGYISKLFKSCTGETVKDYLSIYRVRKAKELMENDSDLTVNKLSAMVGFNHPNNFIRMFKKYEGTSPGRYSKIGQEILQQ